MRTALYVALCLAALVGVVPASLARESRALDPCKPAGPGIEAEQGQQPMAGTNRAVVVDVPIGRVCVGPDSVEGEPSFVRRTKASEGMAIVEVSTTPFMPVLASNEGYAGGSLSIVRPDQPAGW